MLGPNLQAINSLILADEMGECVPFVVAGEEVLIRPKVFIVDDVSKIRHGEHLANSGWCGCSRNLALRTTPPKPAVNITLPAFREYLGQCISHSRVQRLVLSHNTVPGEPHPRPCTAPGCTFSHGTAAETKAEQAKLLAEEFALASDRTTAGKAAFSKWRMKHAHSHLNVQPGEFGHPFLIHHFDRQILDPLHLSELGVPKTPWKHGILVNASDDARERISDKLAEWLHPLDTRRKDNNRVRTQKWFTGEKWATFCAGKRGSPGGPVAIATLVQIIAEDMQLRGVDCGAAEAGDEAEVTVPTVPTVPKPKSNKRGRNLANFASRDPGGVVAAILVSDLPAVGAPALKHVPTAMELSADPADLAIIRAIYGSRAQTLINTLLAFDAYFGWYYPLKESVPFLAPMEVKFPRALANCSAAIDMHEIFERLAIRKHGSFLIHGAIFKVSRDILEVGDIWSTDLSKLELQNADTKRTASSGGARNLTLSKGRTSIAPQRSKTEGPAQLVHTRGYSTTMVLSTMRKLLGLQYLRLGDGLVATPMSRRKERLFGVYGSGRSSSMKVLGMCDAVDGVAINPRQDTCIRAFVRILHELGVVAARV